MPEYGGRKAVHEIEKLYLAAIAATKRVFYIESQYFASRKIAEAIAARLSEPDGPEFIVVNPESADGWLEEEVMGSSRARLLRLIERADVHGRFRLYTPVAERGTPIYVHAKVLVMDDRLLRIGSSNLNNRSMGFDSECDLSIEVRPAAGASCRSSRPSSTASRTPPSPRATFSTPSAPPAAGAPSGRDDCSRASWAGCAAAATATAQDRAPRPRLETRVRASRVHSHSRDPL
jgi:phosphatidylserine/phosphatidylglycerophosphate/cardiolipin synthase-like enzyme